MNVKDKYFNSNETMEALGIKKAKLFKLIKEGILNPKILGKKKEGFGRGPSLLFDKKEVENLI